MHYAKSHNASASVNALAHIRKIHYMRVLGRVQPCLWNETADLSHFSVDYPCQRQKSGQSVQSTGTAQGIIQIR